MSGTRCCLATLALGAFGLACTPCLAQEPSVATHVNGADVRLETKDGQTHFKLDEPIILELVFTAHTPGFTVNTVNYGDLSEQVNITPAEGWFRHHGSSGHDYLSTTKLEDEPIRIPVLLNQGIVFQKPGHYEISMTTGRLIASQPGFAGIRLTTNSVAIEITAPDEQEESALVRSLSAQIETSRGQPRRDAALQLAFLAGDDAVRAKVHFFLDPGTDPSDSGQDPVRHAMFEGLASSRNLKLQLDLLEDAWHDVRRAPDFSLLDAMQQARAFLRKQTVPGWSMVVSPKTDDASSQADLERQNDVSELVASLLQRTGENRRDTVYLLMEFNGLTDSEKALVRPAVLAEFGQMQPIPQAMLLETRWKDIRDPSLIPNLQAMLDAPDEVSAHRDALQRLIELSPDAAKPYALREICDPMSDVMLEQLADLPEETLPEVDACLTAQLRALDGPHNHRLEWKAMLAARFGTKNMLPAMQEIYAGRKDWNPQSDVGAFLAYFLRYSPQEALVAINSLGPNTQPVFFFIDKVFDARKITFPNELQAWFREKLKNGSVGQAGLAAYQLSRFGKPEDKLLVQQKLDRLRQQWSRHGPEIEAAPMATPEAEARKLEVNLVSALAGPDARAWTLTPDEKATLLEGCLTSDCRRDISPAP
jgi:hypothetical protein